MTVQEAALKAYKRHLEIFREDAPMFSDMVIAMIGP